jgi:hypothetical protein
MKEFCNRFIIYLVSDIQKIENNRVVLKADRAGLSLDSDDLYFEPAGETSDAGRLYSIDTTVVIDKLPSVVSNRFKADRSVVIEVHCNNNNDVYLIGSMEYPAKVSITAQLNKDELKIHSKSLQSPL